MPVPDLIRAPGTTAISGDATSMTATGAAGAIAGYISGTPGDADGALLSALGAALAHRGENEQTVTDDKGSAGFVVRGGDGSVDGLPDGSYAVALNGPAGDVLAGWKTDGLDTFDGAARAAAIRDPGAGTLVLVAGTVPLYYAELPGDPAGVAFASEPAALVRAGVVPAAADDERVLEFVLTGGGEDGERTFFAGVRRLPAGQLLEVGTGAPRPLTFGAAGFGPAAAKAAFAAAERPAVRLGDGLPGAALAALAVDASDQPAAAVFSASFAPMETTEDLYVGAVGAALGATVHAVRVNADTLASDLPEFLRIQGEPVADLAAYVQYAVARTAHEGGADRLVDPAGAVASYRLTPTAKGKPAKRTVPPASLLRAAPASAPGGRSAAAALAEVRRAADRSSARAGLIIDTPLAGVAGPATGPGAGLTAAAGAADEAALRGLLPAGAPGDVRPSAPVRDWLLRLKNRIYGTFLAESFVNRPWFAQQPVLVAFEDFIKGRNNEAELFWRIWCVEMWAQEFLDPRPEESGPAHIKGPLEPNAKKKLEITLTHAGREERWLRYPVRTELFTSGDDYATRISGYISAFATAYQAGDDAQRPADGLTRPWYLLVSEKIVAISQGRSYFIWDIEPSWWARTLSKFVVRTPYGIGLGSPWTMELAIKEAGLARILLAAGVSAAGKAVGKRGLFYQVAGHSVRAIDGPTEYSVYPANVSAKLAPAHPGKVATQLRGTVAAALKEAGFDAAAGALAGVVVIDANDIGRNVLGSDADRPDVFFEELFGDNPLGQGSEQTPLAVAIPAT